MSIAHPTAFQIAVDFTMAWLYIEPIREGDSNEPAGDPVDSEPGRARESRPRTDGLFLAKLSYPA